jgi:type I restriction enzyme S subunit
MEVKPGYKKTEVGVVPEDWSVSPLGALAEISSGTTPARALFDRYYKNGSIAWVKTMDLTNSNILHTSECVTDIALKETSLRLYPIGTVLVAMYGGFQQIGRTGLLRLPAAVNQAITAIRPRPRQLVSEYLLATLNHRVAHWRTIASSSRKDPNITGQDVRSFPIAYPQSPEQRVIAEALSDVDGLLATLDRLIRKKRDLRQAAMQQLLTGRTRLPNFDGQWQVKRLADIVDTDPENLGSDTRPDFAFKYIAVEDVDRGTLRSYTEQVFAAAPSRARRKLRPGDVLVSTVRPNLQSHLLFGGGTGNWVCSTGFCVVRCRRGVTNPAYIFAHLFTAFLNQQIEALLAGSNYPAINSGDVRALQMPIPDYPEQTAIVEVLSDMDAELATLEQRREKTHGLKQAMMQELLTGKTRLV